MESPRSSCPQEEGDQSDYGKSDKNANHGAMAPPVEGTRRPACTPLPYPAVREPIRLGHPNATAKRYIGSSASSRPKYWAVCSRYQRTAGQATGAPKLRQ